MATEVRTGSIYGIGVYGTDIFGLSNTAITVDGVGASGSVGTSVVTADAPVVVTGVSATSSLGTIEVDINIIGRPDADIPMAGSVGTAVVTADAPVSVTGVSATNEVGVLPTPDSVYDVVGVQGTTAVNGGYTDKYDGFLAYGNTTNAIYGEGVYGTSRYGFVDTNLFHEVDAVTATGAIGSVSIAAGSDVNLNIFVSAEVITDSELIVGDEVTVTADANTLITGVVATGSAGDIGTRTENRFTVDGVESTGSVGTTVVTADSVTTVSGVQGTSDTDDVVVVAQSLVSVTGVSATATLDEGFVARNNARPTFSGVTATNSPGNVTISTTTVIFNSANKDHDRTTYVEPDKPRIVYVRAA